MSLYLYKGSLSADTINGIDYVFTDGKLYSLPESNKKVQRMEKLGYLKLVKTGDKEASKSVKKGTDVQKRAKK